MNDYNFKHEYVFQYESVKLGLLDALTMSYDGNVDFEVHESLRQVVETQKARGFVPRDWYGNGYRGWRLGSLRFGIHDKQPGRCLMMVSGPLTAMVAHLIKKGGKATRVDFAVDVMSEKPARGIRNAFQAIWQHYDLTCEQSYNSNFYGSRNGGFTYTRGQRGKGMYFRAYDKGAEQVLGKDWWWRFELEVKTPQAQDGIDKWLDSDNPTDFCIGVVERYMEHRDLPSPNRLGKDVEPVRLSRISYFDPELKRKIAWLTKTVKPFLHKLRNYVTIEEIIEILDLKNEVI